MGIYLSLLKFRNQVISFGSYVTKCSHKVSVKYGKFFKMKLFKLILFHVTYLQSAFDINTDSVF